MSSDEYFRINRLGEFVPSDYRNGTHMKVIFNGEPTMFYRLPDNPDYRGMSEHHIELELEAGR